MTRSPPMQAENVFELGGITMVFGDFSSDIAVFVKIVGRLAAFRSPNVPPKDAWLLHFQAISNNNSKALYTIRIILFSDRKGRLHQIVTPQNSPMAQNILAKTKSIFLHVGPKKALFHIY